MEKFSFDYDRLLNPPDVEDIPETCECEKCAFCQGVRFGHHYECGEEETMDAECKCKCSECGERLTHEDNPKSFLCAPCLEELKCLRS